jgi:tetratricopeptide (TPR) repeat protein
MKRFAALALSAGALVLALSCSSAPAKSAAIPQAPAAAQAAPAIAGGLPAASPQPEAGQEAAARSEDSIDEAAIAAYLKPYGSASKACMVALEKASRLVAEGKWLSAFKAMEDFDQANMDPFALAMKTSIVLRGAVRSDMNLSFGLADLEQDQDLESLRNTEGDYAPQALDPPALAEAQASKGVTAPGILSKELGDYYYDVLGRFSGQWALSDEEIMAKIADSYSRAYAAGVYDGPSLMNFGETLVRLDRGDESDPVYEKAMELDPSSAGNLYSYAMALNYRGKKAEALPYVDRAISAYGGDPARINAIALGAQIATELGDEARAQAFFAIADKDYADTPTPGILRHLVAIQTGNKAGAAAAADALVDSHGSNPSVVRTLVSSWYSAGDAEAARDFLKRNIARSSDPMTVATLDFYLAVLLSQGSPSDEDKALALVALDDAESRFKGVVEADNQVYQVIGQMRAELQPKLPEADKAGK